MKLHRRRPGRRGGFTLIELMVVVTIIAVLVSLLSSAIIVAINKMDEVKTRNEISSLGSGLVQFQTDFNVQKSAPPSRIWLRQNVASYNTGNQIDTDSLAYLHKVWPHIYSSQPGMATSCLSIGTATAPPATQASSSKGSSVLYSSLAASKS